MRGLWGNNAPGETMKTYKIITPVLFFTLLVPSAALNGTNTEHRRKIKRINKVNKKAQGNSWSDLFTIQNVAIGSALTIITIFGVKKFFLSKEDEISLSTINNLPTLPDSLGCEVKQAIARKQGSNLRCGYHAVKNAIALGNEQHHELLTNADFCEGLIGPEGEWQKPMADLAEERNDEIGNSVYPTNGEDLDQHGIEEVITKARKHGLLETHETIKVISTIDQLTTDELNTLRTPGVHRIVLRTGMRRMGHWIALAINRGTDNTVYEVADSSGKGQYPEINNLISAIEQKQTT